MIKFTIADNVENICNFIDNQLILLMAEKKIRQFKPLGDVRVIFKKEYRIQNIDNTILYFEKEPHKATLLITTSETKANKSDLDHFGITIINTNDNEADFYIENLHEAFNKGILKREMKNYIFTIKPHRYLVLGLILFIVFGIIIVSGGLLFILFAIAIVLISPIIHLIEKRNFNRMQKKMRKVASIFEDKFQTSQKTITKDWISFFNKVKSNFNETITP